MADRAVATIGPASGGTGKALKEALRANRPDGAWADELRELRDGLTTEKRERFVAAVLDAVSIEVRS